MADLEPLHAEVKFGNSIPIDARNRALLAFERMLREYTGLRVEVFQNRRGDDSKLRALMTDAQREKL